MRLAKIKEEQAQGLRKKKEKKKQEPPNEPPPHTRRRVRDKKQAKPPPTSTEPKETTPFSELYELERLLYQAKRVINGEEMILYLDENVAEEREYLMTI